MSADRQAINIEVATTVEMRMKAATPITNHCLGPSSLMPPIMRRALIKPFPTTDGGKAAIVRKPPVRCGNGVPGPMVQYPPR